FSGHGNLLYPGTSSGPFEKQNNTGASPMPEARWRHFTQNAVIRPLTACAALAGVVSDGHSRSRRTGKSPRLVDEASLNNEAISQGDEARKQWLVVFPLAGFDFGT